MKASDRLRDEDPTMSLGAWRKLQPEDPVLAWSTLLRIFRAAAGSHRPRRVDIDDVVQEAIYRYCIKSPLRLQFLFPAEAVLFRWALRVTRRMGFKLDDQEKRRSKREDAVAGEQPEVDISDPVFIAEAADDARDFARRLTIVIEGLDPPFRQIAELRRRGATRKIVASYLHAWRGVGDAEARRLWRKTDELLRAAFGSPAVGESGTTAPNQRQDSAWNTSPPLDLDAYVE